MTLYRRFLSVALVIAVAAGTSEAGLVAHWKFDEGSGGLAHDETGNHDGSISGAGWTNGHAVAAFQTQILKIHCRTRIALLRFHSNDPRRTFRLTDPVTITLPLFYR